MGKASLVIIAKCLGHGAEPSIRCAGLYLKAFDFEAAYDDQAPIGSGRPTFTADPAEAMQFGDLVEFHAFYVRQPEAAPIRWDGQPNRPMTGYHWTFVDVKP
jgi:hypothetical protein